MFHLWHRHLGHANAHTVKRVLHVLKPQLSINNTHFLCDACAMSKHHALPFTPSTIVYTTPLQLIVSDLWGPTYKMSKNGSRYYITFMDVFSRYSWIYFLQSKSEAFPTFVHFKTTVENLLGTAILQLQTDEGGAFYSFIPFINEHGIIHHITCHHTSQQNGIFERNHRHIVDTGLTLLSQSFIP